MEGGSEVGRWKFQLHTGTSLLVGTLPKVAGKNFTEIEHAFFFFLQDTAGQERFRTLTPGCKFSKHRRQRRQSLFMLFRLPVKDFRVPSTSLDFDSHSGAQGAILVYDVCNRDSFRQLDR